ncbi:hypothetical protein [Mesorhizobium delmotii]|uniref:Oligosaccharide repeat unit polymerase n=1 Tax=Mesorhizobium delmotii TaxID=1631247 RepID=A0A2P9AF31_9HYPH|nr:hypothetical protein [Mesorhizobium delmotii]SJM29737.1 membrane hypothetical protein [Mesorhizobium delmotii]
MLTLTIFLSLSWILYSFYRYGVASFPFLYVVSSLFYLILLPLLVGDVDLVTGTYARPTEVYYWSVIVFCACYMIGFRVTAPLAFTRVSTERYLPRHGRLGEKIVLWSLCVFAGALVAFSLVSRNIFRADGPFLFTIIGFDILLVCYFIGRNERSNFLNIVFILIQSVVFLYAGFRYRLAILFLSELMNLPGRGFRPVRAAVAGGIALMLALGLGALGQVRSYGTFSVVDLGDLAFAPLEFLKQSGEQTVAFATINIVEGIDRLQLVGLEPITVLTTQFVPAALYPDKPRTTYLGSYLIVTEGLQDTGAAFHDLGQAALMYGLYGLPFSAALLGGIAGLFFQSTLKRSPNVYYSCGVIVLYAVLIPTRGYLAQQMTWALTFLVPLLALDLARKVFGDGIRHSDGKTYRTWYGR